jgi:hypothetical protein
MPLQFTARLLAALTTITVVVTMVLPSIASATVYQYGCCSTSNGVVLKTTDGWLVRTSNNRNTPAGSMYRLDGFYYDGSPTGTNYYALSSTVQNVSVTAGGYSARHDCANVSGSFLINVSCWTIQ